MTQAYYNEHDPKAAAWLRELIADGLIAPGVVDERSIEDVIPRELMGYTQCHFFAGIGVWSYALRQAGWPDDRPAWTGSCPCQPFSTTGKRGGAADERHLWPAWFWLISQCRPDVIYGEQVGGKLGRAWFGLVSSDLGGIGYTGNVKELPAAGFGAPHIRQRLFFVADAASSRRQSLPAVYRERDERNESPERRAELGIASDFSLMADTQGGHRRLPVQSRQSRETRVEPERGSEDEPGRDRSYQAGSTIETGPTHGFWRDAEWVYCRDNKWRPTEPGAFPLVARASPRMVQGGDQGEPGIQNTPEARVMRLRGYGNAIVAPVATEFIQAYLSQVD